MKHLITIFIILFFITSCSQSYDEDEFKKNLMGTWYSTTKVDSEYGLLFDIFSEYKINRGGSYNAYFEVTIIEQGGGKIGRFTVKENGHLSIANKQLIWKSGSFNIENFSSEREIITKELVREAFETYAGTFYYDEIISYDENKIELKSIEDGTTELLTRAAKK